MSCLRKLYFKFQVRVREQGQKINLEILFCRIGGFEIYYVIFHRVKKIA